MAHWIFASSSYFFGCFFRHSLIVLVQQWRMDDSQTQTHIVWQRVSCLVINESYIMCMDKLPKYLLSDCLFFLCRYSWQEMNFWREILWTLGFYSFCHCSFNFFCYSYYGTLKRRVGTQKKRELITLPLQVSINTEKLRWGWQNCSAMFLFWEQWQVFSLVS